MFFIPTFLRRSFSVQALGQSSLTIFLLSSALCLLVSSHTIDDSCKHYKGEDITGDIERAINEVKEMALNARIAVIHQEIGYGTPRIKNLLDALFNTDYRRLSPVYSVFDKLAALDPTADFVVICGDQDVQLEPDHSETPDPKGIWIHHQYEWFVRFDAYIPCDSARKPSVNPQKIGDVGAFTMGRRLIYLCPLILDRGVGRSVAPYKDQELAGHYIEEFVNLSVVLLHEILHTKGFNGIDAEVREYPPLADFHNPNTDVSDPSYISSLPMTRAYEFRLCHKLAVLDNSDLTIRNCQTFAFVALGLYLHRNNWGAPLNEGFATPI